MIDALLLDWEGVLADTRRQRQDALRAALTGEGVRLSDADVEECARGRSAQAAAELALRRARVRDATLSELVTLRSERAFADLMSGGVVLVPGALSFVERMQPQVPLAMVSRASRAVTELVLRLSGLDAAFATAGAAEDADVAAPSPAQYERALAQLGRRRRIAARRVIALADAGAVIDAAMGAGVRVVAVGVPAHDALSAHGAIDSIDGATVEELSAAAGLPAAERPA